MAYQCSATICHLPGKDSEVGFCQGPDLTGMCPDIIDQGVIGFGNRLLFELYVFKEFTEVFIVLVGHGNGRVQRERTNGGEVQLLMLIEILR